MKQLLLIILITTFTQYGHAKETDWKSEFDDKYKVIATHYNDRIYKVIVGLFEKKLYLQATLTAEQALKFDTTHDKIKTILEKSKKMVAEYEKDRTAKKFYIKPSKYRKALRVANNLKKAYNRTTIDKFSTLFFKARKKLGREKYLTLLTNLQKINIESERLRKAKGEKNIRPWGWITPKDQKMFKKKYLPIDGKWMKSKAAQKTESKNHNTWATSWEIKTEHFIIKSDVNFKTLMETANALEDHYDNFYKLMGTEMGLKEQKNMVFYYFSNKANFMGHASNCYPNMGSSTAGYCSSRCDHLELKHIKIDNKNKIVSHFFHNKADLHSTRGTLLHEAVHHFLNGIESAFNTPGYVGGQHNNFVVEGVASYFEPPVNKMNKKIAHGKRMVANKKAHSLKIFIPMTQRTLYSLEGVNGTYYGYCQATSLVHYFMHSNKEKYRKPFVEFVYAVHASSTGPKSFEEDFFGKKPETFEKDFTKYMTKLKKQ